MYTRLSGRVFSLFRALISVTGLIILGNALAQENNESASGATLEEVIVTAQKREQDVQSLSISVTALDEDAIARAGITDISRIELVTPGVTYAFIGHDAKINVRGANSDNTFEDHASIAGAFIDGVYQPRAAQQRLGYFDVQRIEVLKGPQGTLYGRNTFAGAINIYTNGAGLEGLDFGVDVTAARFNKVRTEAYVNMPVSDNFALRVAGVHETSDGWVENVGAGENLGVDNQRNFRISALWEPNDEVSVTARYTSLSEGGTSIGFWGAEPICVPVNANGVSDALGSELSCGAGQGGLGIDPMADKPWVVNFAGDSNRDISSENATLQVDWALGEVSVRSITSFTAFESAYTSAAGASPHIGMAFSNWDENIDSFTQELVAFSTSDSDFQWTVGAYYSQDELFDGFSWLRTATYGGYTQTGLDSLGNPHVIRHPTAFVDPFGGGRFSDFNAFQTIDTDTTGLFAQAEWTLNDQFRIIGGVRHNEEKKDIAVVSGTSGLTRADAPFGYRQDGGLGRPLGGFSFPSSTPVSQETFDKVTWKVGFEYHVEEDRMFYGNSSTGFLSGGLSNDGSAFDQQDSEAIEFGYKSRWLQNTLQLNVAIYQTDYLDLTTQKLIDLDGDGELDQTVSVNSGDMTTKGLEFDLTWLPSDAWRLGVHASFMDNEFGEFGVVNPFSLLDGIPAGEVDNGFIDLSGGTPPWSPDVAVGLTASYDADLGSRGVLTPYLQIYYSDGYGTDDVPIYSTQFQDSYHKTDFRLMWSSADSKWGAQAFVENIENEAVLARTQTGGPTGGINSSYIYPRNYGVKVSYRY